MTGFFVGPPDTSALGFFEAQLRRISPPWLSRRVGRAVMSALGRSIDFQRDRVADGVRARFPGIGPDDALSYLGADRVIIRGPDESAATYARRLRLWWDTHLTRGGPYALLGQLFAFWRDTLNVPIDLVGNTGTRYAMDVDGAIVRDRVTWSRTLFDGGTHWSKIWIFFYTPSALDVTLIADTGDEMIAGTGDTIIGSISLAAYLGGPLPGTIEDNFRLVPRAWSAAHIETTTIVLLFGTGGLWDFPLPIPTWTDEGLTGALWDDDQPIQIVIEG